MQIGQNFLLNETHNNSSRMLFSDMEIGGPVFYNLATESSPVL